MVNEPSLFEPLKFYCNVSRVLFSDWLESCLNNDDELELNTRAIKDDKSPEERKGMPLT